MHNHPPNVNDEVREILRDHGLRATSPRVSVLVALHDAGAPRTHEQVMSDLPQGTFDKASIWRILADLADAGVLRRMDLGDRVWRYELLDACRAVTDDHPHFLCDDCGDVSCLPPLQLRTVDGTMPDALLGADIRVRVSGRCADCTANHAQS